MTSATLLRKTLRAQRRELSEATREEADSAIVSHLAKTHLFRGCRTLAAFLPNDGEPDLSALQQRARAMGKTWHLPIIGLPYINHLWFAPYCEGDLLLTNRYGIDEPDLKLCQATVPWSLDLILLPLVAFDDCGNRIGMGGGFYDRTLKFLRHRRVWRRPRLLGIAYAFQQVKRIKPQSWDIPLDAVVTEEGIYGGERLVGLSNGHLLLR